MTFPKFRTSSPPPLVGRLDALTGLRWWAAFAVFAFHARKFAPLPGYSLMAYGNYGVSFFLCTIWFCAYLVGKTYRYCATVLVSQVRTDMAGSYGGLANCYPDISPLVALPSKLVGTTFLCLPTGAVYIIFTRLLHTP